MKPPPGDVSSYDLQRLDTAEIENLAGLCRELFEDSTWPATAVAGLLDAPGCFALLARTAGLAVGLVLVRVTADECEILWLVVRPSWRRRGIGRGLLQAALERAASLGAGTAYLEVSEANRAAATLYGDEEFQPYGLRRAYYESDNEDEACDALLYKKALDSIETCPSQSSVNRMKTFEAQAK